MIDEPLVIPFSPGAALARLAQVEGALARHPHIAQAISSAASTEPETTELARSLQEARRSLTQALAGADAGAIQTAFAQAQQHLLRCFETVCEAGRWNQPDGPTQLEALHALGFPDPQKRRDSIVDPVDVNTILTTYFKPQRQVLTTIAFSDAAGATAYWLNEIRVVAGEDYEDQLIENYAPVFPRVRLSIGRHRLRIEARNPHARAVSAEFVIEVPDL